MKFASHYIIDILEPTTQELVLVVEDRMGGKHHINCLKNEYDNYVGGMLIQQAFPNMSPVNRELLISGYTEDMWNQLMMDEFDDIGNNYDPAWEDYSYGL